MLLAPQRERLFPTLVSRSFVLTLAWPDPGVPAVPRELGDEDPAQWADALAAFYRTGRGWFARTSAKGRVPRLLAAHILLACSRALSAALSGRPVSGLGRYLAELADPGGVRFFDVLLAECQEALVTRSTRPWSWSGSERACTPGRRGEGNGARRRQPAFPEPRLHRPPGTCTMFSPAAFPDPLTAGITTSREPS
jgi:hypothetical protein